MSQRSGRIQCPKCAANNFDTVTVCWKCGTPLQPVPGVTPPAQAAAPASQPYAAVASAAPLGGSAVQWQAAPAPMTYDDTTVNTAAHRAALWFGLLFPYFGLPVAMVMLMVGNRRNQEVARTCILWSVISLVVHLLLMLVVGIGTREMMFALLRGAQGAASRAGSAGGYGGGM